MTQGLADALQPIDGADAGQDVRGVGALPAAGLQPATFAAALQEEVQQPWFGRAGEEAAAKLTQDGTIEAGVGEFQAEGLLPVDTGTNGLGRLTVGEFLHKLQDRDQGEPPGCLGGLATRWVEGSEVVIGEEGAQLIAEEQAGVRVGKSSTGDAGRLLGNGGDGVKAQRHRQTPLWAESEEVETKL